MSGQILCISLQTGRHTDRKSVHTSRRSSVSVGSQESNMFDSCDRYDDRFENSEFDCSNALLSCSLYTQVHACLLNFACCCFCVNHYPI